MAFQIKRDKEHHNVSCNGVKLRCKPNVWLILKKGVYRFNLNARLGNNTTNNHTHCYRVDNYYNGLSAADSDSVMVLGEGMDDDDDDEGYEEQEAVMMQQGSGEIEDLFVRSFRQIPPSLEDDDNDNVIELNLEDDSSSDGQVEVIEVHEQLEEDDSSIVVETEMEMELQQPQGDDDAGRIVEANNVEEMNDDVFCNGNNDVYVDDDDAAERSEANEDDVVEGDIVDHVGPISDLVVGDGDDDDSSDDTSSVNRRQQQREHDDIAQEDEPKEGSAEEEQEEKEEVPIETSQSTIASDNDNDRDPTEGNRVQELEASKDHLIRSLSCQLSRQKSEIAQFKREIAKKDAELLRNEVDLINHHSENYKMEIQKLKCLRENDHKTIAEKNKQLNEMQQQFKRNEKRYSRRFARFDQCLTNIMEEMQCPICLAPTKKAVMLSCEFGHVMCGACADQFFDAARQRQSRVATRSNKRAKGLRQYPIEADCPSCRAKVCNLGCTPVNSRENVVRELIKSGVYPLEETQAYFHRCAAEEFTVEERARALKWAASNTHHKAVLARTKAKTSAGKESSSTTGEDRKRRASGADPEETPNRFKKSRRSDNNEDPPACNVHRREQDYDYATTEQAGVVVTDTNAPEQHDLVVEATVEGVLMRGSSHEDAIVID